MRCVAAYRPGEHPRTAAIRDRLVDVISTFVASGRADPKFLDELQIDERAFWSCASEALVFCRLVGKVFPERKLGHGPDLLVVDEGRRLWIEVVCPQAMRVPQEWLNPAMNGTHSLPHRELLLRWTAAIRQKANALVGVEGGAPGYLEKRIVGAGDAYVIAVNGCRLRSGPFPAEGISGLPLAAEAVFPIGPRQVTLNRQTLEVVGRGHEYRPSLTTDSGQPVDTRMFLDPRFAAVSAIWGIDLDGGSAIGNSEPSVVVHNPHATVPVSRAFLPADAEYDATWEGEDLVITERLSRERK